MRTILPNTIEEGTAPVAVNHDFRIGHPTLFTQDVDRLTTFYESLGFIDGFRFPPAGDAAFVVVFKETFYITITQIEVIRQTTGLPLDSTGPGRAFDITVIVDDVDEVVEKLRAADVPVLMEPRDQPWGDRHAYVADPDGNFVQLTTHANHDMSQFADFNPEWGSE